MFIFNAYRLPVKTEAVSALAAFAFSSVLLLKAVSFSHPFIKARLMPKKAELFHLSVFYSLFISKNGLFPE